MQQQRQQRWCSSVNDNNDAAEDSDSDAVATMTKP